MSHKEGSGGQASEWLGTSGLASCTSALAWLGDGLPSVLESGLQYLHIDCTFHIGAFLHPPWRNEPASGSSRALNPVIRRS